MSGNKAFGSLFSELSSLGMGSAVSAMEKLVASADVAWKRTVLMLVADAVKKHGPSGIEKAQRAIERALAGKTADMSFASLRVRSDVLVHLQNAEDKRKTATQAYMRVVVKTLGQIIAAVIKGIVAAR